MDGAIVGFNRAARFARLVATQLKDTFSPGFSCCFNRAARFARLVALSSMLSS